MAQIHNKLTIKENKFNLGYHQSERINPFRREKNSIIKIAEKRTIFQLMTILSRIKEYFSMKSTLLTTSPVPFSQITQRISLT